MNPTIQLIFTILGGAMVLLSAYGAIRLNRRLFNSGFCFYSILPIIGESMGYNADKASVHIVILLIFVAQFILEFPDGKTYGSSNPIAIMLASKIGLTVLVINAGGALYVLCLNSGLPVQFGFFHIGFILIMLYALFKGNTAKLAWIR